MISGSTDWDDQKYPSALDLAEFYFSGISKWKTNKPGWALESLCYAIHMLQDMSVPQHVLCTIEKDHPEYERDMLKLWNVVYANRSPDERAKRLATSIGPSVGRILQTLQQNSIRALGEKLVDRLVEIWLNTPFDGGRHARRNEKIISLENRDGKP